LEGTEPTPIKSIDLVYAAALLDLAEESKQLDEIAAEVAQLEGIGTTEPALTNLLSSRVLSVEERAAVLERIFKGRISDLFYRFLQVVNAKERLDTMPGILRAFKKLVQDRHGVVEVVAHVALELDAAQAQQVSDRLAKAINRQVHMKQLLDPELIGGLKLRVGDEIVDASVVTQLKIMRDRIIATGRVKAAELAAQ
jgi:F-type H+-transporting ATPase subunit delta